jgi:transcriptional regulator with XRE-family HTH domain
MREETPDPRAGGAAEPELGARLRARRVAAGLSLARLALATGLTKGYLSKVERGAGQPSIGTVFRIAEALQLPPGQLLAAEGGATSTGTDVARAIPGAAPPRSGDLVLRPLFPEGPGRLIAMEVWPPLEARPPAEASTHAGEEFLHVLSGRMEIAFDDETLVLEEGDSLRFDARRAHRTRSLGRQRARAMVVLFPGA